MNLKKSQLLSDTEDLEFLQSLKNDFFIETTDSLERAEKSLLSFESNKSDLDLLDYKRTLHSVKGSAKAVEEAVFAILLHKIEDTIAAEKNDLFFERNFKFIDMSKNYIQEAKAGNVDSAEAILTEMQKIFN